MSASQYKVDNQARRTLAESVCVGSLCRVEQFDPAKMTVDVQPLSKVLDAGVYRLPPQIPGVPAALIRGGGFVQRPWYAAGDLGVLLYLDHDIDRIAEAGQECEPNTERNHAEEDAVFVGAFVPAVNPLTGLPEEALVSAVDGGEIYSAVKKDEIDIKVGGVRITIKKDVIEVKGNIQLTGNIAQTGNTAQTGRTDATGDVTAQGKSLAAHTHTGTHGETSGPH